LIINASQGAVSVGDTIELPALKVTRAIKSLQCFKRPVTTIQAGDRAGIRLTQVCVLALSSFIPPECPVAAICGLPAAVCEGAFVFALSAIRGPCQACPA